MGTSLIKTQNIPGVSRKSKQKKIKENLSFVKGREGL
jgi:hypothetical protein